MTAALSDQPASPLWQRRAGSWLAIFLIYTAATLFFALVSFAVLALGGEHSDPRQVFLWNGARFYLWAALSPLVVYLAQRLKIDRTNWHTRVLLHIVASLIWSLLDTTLNFVLYWSLASAEVRRLNPSLIGRAQTMGETFALAVLVYWIVLGAVYGIDSYRRYQVERLRSLNLQAELARAQLNVLKMQLQPHFLFNTLNSLTDLVLEDPEAATRMIAQLGDFLRHTIEGPTDQLISLQQELEFVESYLAIEKIRLQDRLEIEMAIEPATRQAQVPNLILQPLVENAIRHGISSRTGNGWLRIGAKQENETIEITISDRTTGAGKVSKEHSPQIGMGLANTRARLNHLYGAEQTLSLEQSAKENMTVVSLVIPFRTAVNE